MCLWAIILSNFKLIQDTRATFLNHTGTQLILWQITLVNTILYITPDHISIRNTLVLGFNVRKSKRFLQILNNRLLLQYKHYVWIHRVKIINDAFLNLVKSRSHHMAKLYIILLNIVWWRPEAWYTWRLVKLQSCTTWQCQVDIISINWKLPSLIHCVIKYSKK